MSREELRKERMETSEKFLEKAGSFDAKARELGYLKGLKMYSYRNKQGKEDEEIIYGICMLFEQRCYTIEQIDQVLEAVKRNARLLSSFNL